jgi:hypothetical protein
MHPFAAALPHQLAAMRRRLGLYLGTPVTAAILFKPVRDATATALRKLSAAVAESASGVSAGDEEAAAAVAALLGQVERCQRALDASDQVSADPASVLFGQDDQWS